MSVRSEILRFLREPAGFAADLSQPSRALWLQGLHDIAEPRIAAAGDYALRPSQVWAWKGLSNQRAGLVLGPPGTGKTYALSWMALGYLLACQSAARPCRILVTAFTLNAIGNLLDALQEKVARYAPGQAVLAYMGNQPAAGLAPDIAHLPMRGGGWAERIWEALGTEHIVVGSSVWGLNKLLARDQVSGYPASGDGRTAPVFDLVCIDEASQMVLSNGLMALAGLVEGGRVLVAGDNKQLPPVRQVREQEVGGRLLGGSLYDFMKSADIAELALDETFRLCAPLTAFPEKKFYPGRYRSADDVADNRLSLSADWRAGLEPWERLVLDPEAPVAVLLHDGPAAGTANPFEARIAVRLVKRLYDVLPRVGGNPDNDRLWQRQLAVVSPHRAQNATIRQALAGHPAAAGAVVETVDRIQGKERDVVIASYTVSDTELAMAEAAFIFSPERLNVTITRARTKLILIVSRRLLDVVPSDEETLDAAQILRELVYDSADAGTVSLTDPEGRSVSVGIRLRGFDGAPLPQLQPSEPAAEHEPLPELTPKLAELLQAIRKIALGSSHGNATLSLLKKELFYQPSILQLRQLLQLGHIRLGLRGGPHGSFWVARWLPSPSIPFPARAESVRERLEEVVSSVRRGLLAPFYEQVRDRFVWLDEDGGDVLLPVLRTLASEDLVRLEAVGNGLTVDWIGDTSTDAQQQESDLPTLPPLADEDFVLLNRLEDQEAARINFGIFEAWSSVSELARALELPSGKVTDALRRLAEHGHLMVDADGRVRSRMAELAREVRYVKQRFQPGDASHRPYLVRSLRVELKERDKPVRDQPLSRVLGAVRDALPGDETAHRVLTGLGEMLRTAWSADDPPLAGFQARAFEQLLSAWRGVSGTNAFVIAADTGSGKTEAAVLPLIAGAACDALDGIVGSRSLLVYPRIRLAANQAQRLAGYLAALERVDDMPSLTLGLQNMQVPSTFDSIPDYLVDLWGRGGSDRFGFPFFACPSCVGQLHLIVGEGKGGADRLECGCGWTFSGWVGSKEGLRHQPPTFFLPVTESLHQWQQDNRYGALFGDRAECDRFAAPRALLADEIHLYTHIHGAQVGHTLRRLLHRATLNSPNGKTPLAIGMSATLGDPVRAWRHLIGREQVMPLRPESGERRANPRGREYFYFVQPEVESRGKDIAGAATSIQALMCLSHGMRRRTGRDGGYRAIVFLDSIDKVKRLHGDYQDAEEGKRLAGLRTYLYDDDPITGQPRRSCCGEPAGCDRFTNGECWYFAATDTRQCTARGAYRPGRALRVAEHPVFSGTSGRVEDMIRGADTVFATSSLEVGYDDPDITLVYQHYAPTNLASFIQRKGRGGRGADDRPMTGVTLSPYSPRDSWYFRRPRRMLDEGRFDVPLNMANHFVMRGQILSLVLDLIARWRGLGKTPLTPATGGAQLSVAFLPEAEQSVHDCFGEGALQRLGTDDLAGLWTAAIAEASPPLGSDDWGSFIRKKLPWVPDSLFTTISLPQVEMNFEADGTNRQNAMVFEAVPLAWDAATPGNPTRRYGYQLVHWVPPRKGSAPWFDKDIYVQARQLDLPLLDQHGVQTLLAALPLEARDQIGKEVHDKACTLTMVRLETAGKRYGGGWTSSWYYDEASECVRPVDNRTPKNAPRVHDKSGGTLRGALLIEVDEQPARPLEVAGFDGLIEHAEMYTGAALRTGSRPGTGLTMTRLVWGADAEVRLDNPSHDPIPFKQTFIHPSSGKTLLHGYRLEVEGVRFHLNSDRLDDFLEQEANRLAGTTDERWHRGRFLRYLIVSRSRATTLNAYEAERAAELLFSAAGHPELREKLKRLLRRWDAPRLRELLTETFARTLSQHPLLSERRIDRLVDVMGGREFNQVFSDSVERMQSGDGFRAYLRSALIESVAARLEQAFVLHGKSDERNVLCHTRHPLSFGSEADDVITVMEHGSQGDGTTRLFVENLDQVLDDWRTGGLAGCPNARQDALMEHMLARTDRHDGWRRLNPRNPEEMRQLAEEVGYTHGLPDDLNPLRLLGFQNVIRVLFGSETVGSERVDLLPVAVEIDQVRNRGLAEMGRDYTTWELVSAVVHAATHQQEAVPMVARLAAAYAAIEDAETEESLSPDARLADQVYRLGTSLCVDGCQGCLHGSGERAELASRKLLDGFVSWLRT